VFNRNEITAKKGLFNLIMNKKTVYTFITGLSILILSIIILKPVNVEAYTILYDRSAFDIVNYGANATSSNLATGGLSALIYSFPNGGTATQFRWRIKRLTGSNSDLNMYLQVRQYPIIGSGTNCISYLSNEQETQVLVSDFNTGSATTTFLVSSSTIPFSGSYNCDFTAGGTYLVNLTSLSSPATSTQFSIQDSQGVPYLEIGGAGGLSPIPGQIDSTTTINTLESDKSLACIPYPKFLGGSFSLIDCVGYLFVPNTQIISNTVTSLTNNVLTVFPLGYITDIVTIFNSNSTSSLPVISATIPNGIIGGGASVVLNPNHALDFVLNATSTIFSTSTQTFYEITNYYWKLVLYILAFIYVVGRILGSGLIGHNKNKNL